MSTQGELFQADTTWFHVFKSMIDTGDAAKMGGTTFLVYAVIKAHTNWSTGRAFPAIETVAEKAGVSPDTVTRSIKDLEKMGYITKEKKGRQNVYSLREKVTFEDKEGRPSAVATWDYLPSTIEAARAELRNFKLTGDSNAPQIINIQRLTLNVQIGDHNHQTNINLQDIKDPELRQQLAKMLNTAGYPQAGESGE